MAVEVKDKVQISAMFTPERAVGGSLKKGDLVGVYLSFDPFNFDEAGLTPRRRQPTTTTPDSTDADGRRRTPPTDGTTDDRATRRRT